MVTARRQQQLRDARMRYYDRIKPVRLAAGQTTRGTRRIYSRWETPGLPRHVRARMTRRYCAMAELMDRIASLLARAQVWLPKELRIESTVLARQLATVKRHNKKRKVRTA